MSIIRRIRQKITNRDYYLSSHAEDEIWADRLERSDVENAILRGRVEKRMIEILEEQDIALRDLPETGGSST
jgi:hypothetical protein